MLFRSMSRYLGKWYEIARLDHSFERGLSQVSAEYTLRDDGGINVVNRGFSVEKNEWKEAKGRGYYVGDPKTGHFKVSFFRPFYGAYIIFELDKNGYQYAFISGGNKSYLWLLSRTPKISDVLIQRFILQAKNRGFDTDKLVYVEQKSLEEITQ